MPRTFPTPADDRVIDEIVAAAPPPSEWDPEKLAELQRLCAPLYRPTALLPMTETTAA